MQLRPYGDTANDGIVQISFTLPLPLDSRARETARRYAMLMGVSNPLVAHAESIDKQFSFFIVYGACTHTMGGRRHPACGVGIPMYRAIAIHRARGVAGPTFSS